MLASNSGFHQLLDWICLSFLPKIQIASLNLAYLFLIFFVLFVFYRQAEVCYHTNRQKLGHHYYSNYLYASLYLIEFDSLINFSYFLCNWVSYFNFVIFVFSFSISFGYSIVLNFRTNFGFVHLVNFSYDGSFAGHYNDSNFYL